MARTKLRLLVMLQHLPAYETGEVTFPPNRNKLMTG